MSDDEVNNSANIYRGIGVQELQYHFTNDEGDDELKKLPLF